VKNVTIKLEIQFSDDSNPGKPESYSGQEWEETLQFPDNFNKEKLGFDAFSYGEMLFNLYRLALCKSYEYGGSWQKRGEIRGPVSNLDRKYDRIMSSIDTWVETGRNEPYPRVDGSVDLAVYVILYASTFLKEHYPKEYERWTRDELEAFIRRYRLTKDDKPTRIPETPERQEGEEVTPPGRLPGRR
jgi:hypothetical protein